MSLVSELFISVGIQLSDVTHVFEDGQPMVAHSDIMSTTKLFLLNNLICVSKIVDEI